MFTEEVKLSSVQINLPDILGKKILKWSHKNIPDSYLYEAPGCGREDELHVTVLFGLHTQSPDLTREIARKTSKFDIELTLISLFTTNPNFDVIKIGVKSQELHELNDLFRKKADYTNRFDKYQPHVTIAYVKKGRGWKYEGNSEFKECMFKAESLMFSNSNYHKTSCVLKSD